MTTKPNLAFRTLAELAEGGKSVDLEFIIDGSAVWAATANAETLDYLITVLGDKRAQLLDIVSNDLDFATSRPFSAINPRWYVIPDLDNKLACLCIRHPGLGWHIYAIPRSEAGSIAKHLIRTPKFKTVEEKIASLSTQATSFGGEDFLITTEGLGFYYFGKGKSRLGTDPFEQIEFDSDRAAGIVAGAVVEQRLTQAIKSKMLNENADHAKIAMGDTFRSSGPLGSFSSKINLAFLCKIISFEAFKDLNILKGIRNDFAHDLSLDTFDSSSIKDRCGNFMIINKHVGPVPLMYDIENIPVEIHEQRDPYLGYPDYLERLANPRFRYTMTAQLLNYALGSGASNPDQILPMI